MHFHSCFALLGLAVAASSASSSVSSSEVSSSVRSSAATRSASSSVVGYSEGTYSTRKTSAVGSSTGQQPSSVLSGHASGTPPANNSTPTNGTASASLTVHATITANAVPANGTNGTSHSSTQTAASNQPSQSAIIFTAHPDGQCQKQLNGQKNTFELDQSKKFPGYTNVKKPTFPGAEAKDAGGWNVYWSIPKPQEGCRYQVMLPFRQYSGTPGYPGGNEIINVGAEGCYFGNVPTDSDVYLGYCCGSADCQKASLNSTSLLSDPITRRRRDATSNSGASNTVRGNDQRSVGDLKPRGGSLASKSSQLQERFWYIAGAPAPKASCKIIEPGQPYSRAGQQVVIGASQICTSSPCSVAVQYTISYSTTATSSKTDTLTTSFGASVAIKAGVDFIADAEVTTTLSTEISNAIAQTTGMDVMRGNSSTVTSTVSLSLGNRGTVTFTPTYQCVTGPLDCGNGTVGPIDFCQPDLSGINGSPAGDYYPLISD